jgi:hypothetical protein
MDVDNVCLDNIHASILVGNLCGAEGESVSEGLFFGMYSFGRDCLSNYLSDLSKVLHSEWQTSSIYLLQMLVKTRSHRRSR